MSLPTSKMGNSGSRQFLELSPPARTRQPAAVSESHPLSASREGATSASSSKIRSPAKRRTDDATHSQGPPKKVSSKMGSEARLQKAPARVDRQEVKRAQPHYNTYFDAGELSDEIVVNHGPPSERPKSSRASPPSSSDKAKSSTSHGLADADQALLPEVSAVIKKSPHAFVPSSRLAPSTKNLNRLRRWAADFEPLATHGDMDGYYIMFENNAAGRRDLAKCCQKRDLLGIYDLRPEPRPGNLPKQTSAERKSTGHNPHATTGTRIGRPTEQKQQEVERVRPSSSGGLTSASDMSNAKKQKCHMCLEHLLGETLYDCSTCSRQYHASCHLKPRKPSLLEVRNGWQCARCIKKGIPSRPRVDKQKQTAKGADTRLVKDSSGKQSRAHDEAVRPRQVISATQHQTVSTPSGNVALQTESPVPMAGLTQMGTGKEKTNDSETGQDAQIVPPVAKTPLPETGVDGQNLLTMPGPVSATGSPRLEVGETTRWHIEPENRGNMIPEPRDRAWIRALREGTRTDALIHTDAKSDRPQPTNIPDSAAGSTARASDSAVGFRPSSVTQDGTSHKSPLEGALKGLSQSVTVSDGKISGGEGPPPEQATVVRKAQAKDEAIAAGTEKQSLPSSETHGAQDHHRAGEAKKGSGELANNHSATKSTVELGPDATKLPTVGLGRLNDTVGLPTKATSESSHPLASDPVITSLTSTMAHKQDAFQRVVEDSLTYSNPGSPSSHDSPVPDAADVVIPHARPTAKRTKSKPKIVFCLDCKKKTVQDSEHTSLCSMCKSRRNSVNEETKRVNLTPLPVETPSVFTSAEATTVGPGHLDSEARKTDVDLQDVHMTDLEPMAEKKRSADAANLDARKAHAIPTMETMVNKGLTAIASADSDLKTPSHTPSKLNKNTAGDKEKNGFRTAEPIKKRRTMKIGGENLGDSYKRPKGTYEILIGLAMSTTPDHRMQARGVCTWIASNIDKYHHGVDQWESGIGATLSIHEGKKSKQLWDKIDWVEGESDEFGRGCWYTLKPGIAETLARWDPVNKVAIYPPGKSPVQDVSAESVGPGSTPKRKARKLAPDVLKAETLADRATVKRTTSFEETPSKTLVNNVSKSLTPRKPQPSAMKDGTDAVPIGVQSARLATGMAREWEPLKPNKRRSLPLFLSQLKPKVDEASLLERVQRNSAKVSYNVKSLWDEWPQLDPEKPFDTEAKIAEIKQRPSRKQMFRKGPLHSRSGHVPVEEEWVDLPGIGIDRGCSRDGEKPHIRRAAHVFPQDDNVRSFTTVKEFLGLPFDPVPVLRNGSLAYRDRTRDPYGKLVRARNVYPAGL